MDKGPISHVVAIGSGKGGVGKSSTAALLASDLVRRGSPSVSWTRTSPVPRYRSCWASRARWWTGERGSSRPLTSDGIRIVSSQFMVEDEKTPVIWRGPLVTRLIMQFFGGVNWGKLDYLLIDMPPGTSSDVPLTVFQTIPVDGMVFVLTPQDLAALIVKKAMNMARDLHVPLLGVVENMS